MKNIYFSPMTHLAHLTGYYNANGDYCPSALRDAYEHGHSVALHELDAALPRILNKVMEIINSTSFLFPDGMVARHPNFKVERHPLFVLIAGGST